MELIMNLGRKPFTIGNTRRYSVNYSEWLEHGETLASGTATMLTPGINDIVISGVSVAPSNRLYFTLAGGSANEIFTIAVSITDSRGEVKNDTCNFNCVLP
jgi:hypothetical protein